MDFRFLPGDACWCRKVERKIGRNAAKGVAKICAVGFASAAGEHESPGGVVIRRGRSTVHAGSRLHLGRRVSMIKKLITPAMCGVLMGAAIFGLAAPAMAQADEDIVVTGRYGNVPDNVQSLSQRVSYADLDLATDSGRRILKQRISLTARYLCDKLGETDAGPVVPNCRDAAARDALDRVGTWEAHVAPRGTAWVAGPAWQPPYPSDWDDRYPG
jgi:UrcA family protein